MRARFLFLVVLLTLSVGVFWFAGTAGAQYQYYCRTPDGLTYWAYNPCDYQGAYNNDYDKGHPYNFHQHTFNGTPLGQRDTDTGARGGCSQSNSSKPSDDSFAGRDKSEQGQSGIGLVGNRTGSPVPGSHM